MTLLQNLQPRLAFQIWSMSNAKYRKFDFRNFDRRRYSRERASQKLEVIPRGRRRLGKFGPSPKSYSNSKILRFETRAQRTWISVATPPAYSVSGFGCPGVRPVRFGVAAGRTVSAFAICRSENLGGTCRRSRPRWVGGIKMNHS